jgi:hypothetical protein
VILPSATISPIVAFLVAFLIMALLSLLGITVVRVRASKRHLDPEDPLVRSGTWTLDRGAGFALNMAIAAMKSMGGRDVIIDEENVRACAELGMSWRSYGQRLEVSVRPVDEDHSSIEARTWPSKDRQVVDGGAGRVALAKFVEKLKSVYPDVEVEEEDSAQ